MPYLLLFVVIALKRVTSTFMHHANVTLFNVISSKALYIAFKVIYISLALNKHVTSALIWSSGFSLIQKYMC